MLPQAHVIARRGHPLPVAAPPKQLERPWKGRSLHRREPEPQPSERLGGERTPGGQPAPPPGPRRGGFQQLRLRRRVSSLSSERPLSPYWGANTPGPPRAEPPRARSPPPPGRSEHAPPATRSPGAGTPLPQGECAWKPILCPSSCVWDHLPNKPPHRHLPPLRPASEEFKLRQGEMALPRKVTTWRR